MATVEQGTDSVAVRYIAVGLAMAGILTSAVLTLNAMYGATIIALLAAHLFITAGFALLMQATLRDRASDVQFLSVLLLAVVGPLAAIIGGLALASLARNAAPVRLRRSVIDVHAADKIEEFIDRIISGRSIQSGDHTNASFATIMSNGVAEQQLRVLAVIAQKFHPEFLPVLKLALRSEHLSVRASAAALVTALKFEMKERLGRALEAISTVGTDRPEHHLQEAATCLKSGLIDPVQLKRAQELSVTMSGVATTGVGFGVKIESAQLGFLAAAGATQHFADCCPFADQEVVGDVRGLVAAGYMKSGRLDLLQKVLRG